MTAFARSGLLALLLLSCAEHGRTEGVILNDGDVAPCHYRTIVHRGATYDVVFVHLEYADIRIFWQRANGTRIGSFPALHDWLESSGRHLLVATNGGIFLKGFIPAGILVEQGVTRVGLNCDSGWGNFFLKPNGVFAVTAQGALVVSTSQFAQLADLDSVIEATQSGPMLVEHGVIHPVFEDSSFHYNVRSGVAARTPSEVILAISKSEVTLYDFATFFRDELKCDDALYLDGDITRMYAPELGRFDTGSCAGIIGVILRTTSVVQ